MNFLKILFVVFVCFGEFYTDSGRDGGSLLSIYNDLSILARITNAIALQAGSIQKNLNIRDVITELLKAHTESFTALMNNNPKDLIPVVKYIADKGEEVFAKNTTLGNLKELIENLEKAMSTTLPTVIEMQAAVKSFNEPTFKLESLVCDDSTLDQMSAFHSAINPNPNSTKKEDSEYISDIRSIVKHKDSMKQCLTSIKNYQYSNQAALDVFTNIGAFIRHLSFTELNSDAFMKLPSQISMAQDLFIKAKDIWTDRERSGIYKTITQIEDLLKAISDHEKEPTPKLCVGFPGDDDVEKVTSDVKSDWFQKNIARGKSTSELEKALEPYEAVGRKLKSLKLSYKEFHELFRHESDFVNSMTEKVRNIEEFNGFGDGEQVFKDAKGIYENSWKDPTLPTSTNETAKTMGNTFFTAQFVVQHTLSIRKWCQKIVTNFDFDAIEHVIDEIALADLDSHSGLEDLRDEVRGVDDYITLQQLFGEFKEFADHRGAFKFVHGNFAHSSKSFDGNRGTMEQSGLMKNLKRLKNSNFATQRLRESIQFLEDLREYKDNYPKFAEFFNKYDKMKEKLLAVERFIKKMGTVPSKIVVDFKNSLVLSTRFGRGMHVYRDIAYAYSLRDELMKSTEYDPEVNEIISKNPHEHVRDFWDGDREKMMANLIQELKNLEKQSKEFESTELLTMGGALTKAIRVQGIHDFKQGFHDISQQLEDLLRENPNLSNNFNVSLENSKLLEDLDLDFASHKGFLPASALSVDDIKMQYDIMFGFVDGGGGKTVKQAFLGVIGITIAIIFLVLIAIIVIYGLTEKGRTKYKNLYIFYFGKPADFEKRWRYSLFMDRQDGRNALIDAVREINPSNVLKEVKRGAYINVYSLYGNTALHMATKRGYPDIVEILIKNGADRTILNAQNKTPEQMVPEKYQETFPDKIERYEKVEKIYKKYKNKKFRIRVPEVFPSSSFHIFIDDKLDLNLVNAFMLQHKSIVTPTLIPTTTHYIVKTDSDGCLEVDSLESLFWVLSGVIIVKDSWMKDCLKDPKLIEKDYQYLVEKVKYKGTVYPTVTQWTEAMAKSTMPFLHGVYLAVVMVECSNLIHLAAVVTNHGGVVCETFPDKEQFNVGARPYLHSNLGPFFLIHDGKIELGVYKNDHDKMYTLFTEDEFIHFMLARETTVDTTPDLKQVSNDMED